MPRPMMSSGVPNASSNSDIDPNTEIINFWSGDSRIEASNLIAQNVSVFHRSSNDMVVHPIQSITGKMVSTGNVILKNNPPIVDVLQLYQGHLIYN